MERKTLIRKLMAEGKTAEQIAWHITQLEEEAEVKERRTQASLEASAKYYADKELNGGSCKTCGCKLSVSNTSGYCRMHVAKATLTKSPAERAKPTKYVTRTYYGVKSNDLMDRHYYQGGSVSPR